VAGSRRLRIGLLGGGVTIVGIIIAMIIATSGGGASGNGDPAHFDLPALNGPARVQLAAYRGKPVVVNFFASWCTQCRAELPAFASAAQDLKGKVVFIEVNSQETGSGKDMADEFHLAQSGMILAKDVGPYPASHLSQALGAQGMPVTVFYDANGILVNSQLGRVDDLSAKLQQFYGV
jgi:thiol-disulfide isomerase/thioredoxin